MKGKFSKRSKGFLKKARERIADRQKEMLSDAADLLFENSPHFEPRAVPGKYGEIEIMNVGSAGGMARGQYDANHVAKVTRKGRTVVEGPATTPVPLMSRAMSEGRIEQAKARLEYIRCGDKGTIHNETPHADAVEHGGEHWTVTEPYRTYEKTSLHLKQIYGKRKEKL